VREKEREFVHAAGVISRLVCTRVFEPRVLFPLTGEQSARRAARCSLLPPFKPLSEPHRATILLPPNLPAQPPQAHRRFPFAFILPLPRYSAHRSPDSLSLSLSLSFCRLLKTRLAADFPTKE